LVNPVPEEKLRWLFRMYDINGDGMIDQAEMTEIVQAIMYMYPAAAICNPCSATDPCIDFATAKERAKSIFSRIPHKSAGRFITEGEFHSGCLQDADLTKMLAPNVVQ
jgi:Ca2+-binding EF-hand superfamily protein